MLSHASRAVVAPTTVVAAAAASGCSQSSVRRAAVALSCQRGIATALVGELGAALSQSRAQNSHPSGSGARGRQQQRYSTSAASKRWAAASSRRSTVVAPGHLRQRRPIVNGEAVAFHVNDLARRPPPLSSRPSSLGSSSSYGGASSSSQGPSSPPALSSSSSSFSPALSLLDRNSLGGIGRRQTAATTKYESDMVVVLDMDECLIHSQFLSPHNAQFFAYQLLNRTRRGYSNSSSSSASEGDSSNSTGGASARPVDTFRFALPDGDWVYVNLRPGLRDFLRAVSSKYETHIFTASMAVYADPLLDLLDPDGTMIAGRWYREHCAFDADQKAYVKDLDRLPFGREQLNRVVLVDNNPLSFLTHPNNGILVSSFYNDPNDTSLQSVWQLLQELDRQPDVRPHLERRFGIKKALAKLPLGNDNLGCFRAAAIQPRQQLQQQHDQHQPPPPAAVAA